MNAYTFMAALFVVADLIIQSRMADIFVGDILKSIAIATELFILIISVFCVFRMRIVASIMPSLTISFLVLSMGYLSIWVFSSLIGVSANFNAAGQFFGFGFAVVAVACYGDHQRLAKVFYFSSIFYAFLYIYVVISGKGVAADALRLNDDLRGERVYMSAMHISFVVFYALSEILRRGKLINILPLSVAIFCIVLSGSRIYAAIIFLVAAISILFSGIKFAKKILTVFTIIYVGMIFYGIFDDTFNPFLFFIDDESGSVRFNSYYNAVDAFRKNPIFGVGVASFSDDYILLTGTETYSHSDLGFLGILAAFGVFGAFVFFMVFYFSVSSVFFPDYMTPFFWTVVLAMFYNFISPVFFNSSQIFISIMISYSVLNSPGALFNFKMVKN